MREPADLLMLDEPTNDLDIPTLEVLEESLAEFEGGLVLVTHDRFLLERVSTVVLALDGEGGAETFADYAQWETARAARTSERACDAGAAPARARSRVKRLGYLEQREWDGMEQAILEAENARRGLPARGRGSRHRVRSAGPPDPLPGARGRAGARWTSSTRAGPSSRPSSPAGRGGAAGVAVRTATAAASSSRARPSRCSDGWAGPSDPDPRRRRSAHFRVAGGRRRGASYLSV